jgi:hypothetical protein
MARSDGDPDGETPAMSIALTCDCGARFEVEDLFAGQEVNCPECQHPTLAPLVKDPPRRVSLLALYSLVVAVVGAFTLVGSAAAAVLALIALARMHNRRGGAGYAVAALVVAAAGAAATVGILNLPAASQLVGWQRRGGLASRVDTSGPPEVGTRDNACVLTRPAGWGRILPDRGTDLAIGYLQADRDVILAGPQGEAYIDIRRDAPVPRDLQGYGERLGPELRTPPPAADEEEDLLRRPNQQDPVRMHNPVVLPEIGGYEGVEWVADLERGNQTWRWLVRVYRKKPRAGEQPGPVYVLRAYAPIRRYRALEPELKKTLDGVRFTQ